MPSESVVPAVHDKTINLCKYCVRMTAISGSGHPSSGMSISHLVTALMYHSMRWDPKQPDHAASDRLVLSEGHAVPIVYAAYADLGGVVGKPGEARRPLSIDDLWELREAGSVLDGHPNPMEGFPFFDAATGSLGQGLSVAAGLGIAARMDDNDRRIYCIIGDGESREGQVWEAVDLIVDERLTNVLPIFNCNLWGQSDKVSPQQSAETLAKKLEAAGVEVRVIDGHDPAAIISAYEAFAKRSSAEGVPMAVVARTVKGWGSTTLQSGNWHGKPPAIKEIDKIEEELDQQRLRLVPGMTATEMILKVPAPTGAATRAVAESADLPSFSEAMAKYDMANIVRQGSFATRKAYGVALRALGHANPDIVVLDADVKNSTFAQTFSKDAALADRFIECRIAEQNMVSAAVGLSAAGKIPFVSTFGKFLTRAYDQIEMAVYSGANLKLVGSHVGVSLAADGPSQMALPDVAWFRAFSTVHDHRGNPGFFILQPSDAYAAYALTLAMAEYEGACYMRTLRPETEFLYSDDTVFNLGGFEVLSEGRDLLICASGYMVHEANKALEGLDQAGIDATIVDMYSIPFDAEKILDLANANNGMVLTIEDNFGNALGAAVADALAEDGSGFTLDQMHVTRIPKSARTPEETLKMVGLSHADIVSRACRLLNLAGV